MATNLDVDLRCPICQEVYQDPVLLRCGHNFCRGCMQRHVGSAEKTPMCPCCRSRFKMDSVYPNRQLANVIAGLRDLSAGPSMHPSNRHCAKHKKELELFCQDDKQPICYICALAHNHRNHNCVPIDEAYKECKGVLNRSITMLQKEVTDRLAMHASQGGKISRLLDMTENLRNDIAKQFEAMHNFLDERERAIIKELAEEENHVLIQLEENMLTISGDCNMIQAIIQDIDEVINSEDCHQLLREYVSLKKRSEAIYNAVLNTPVFKLGVFYSPLQYGTWKQMKDIIKIVPAALSFDPRTANPKLRVSNFGQRLQYCEVQSQRPDTPERFTNHLSVFASTALSSGRYYWEVNVSEGADWILGVAAGSVNKKVCAVTSPDNGYWTIGHRSGGQYWACGHEKVAIHPDINVEMIGVYLDYEKGQLSFYDAEDMSHIHTFKHHFLAKLYPYFSISPNVERANPSLMLLY
ncbi:E3 ubiquitin-protein ligase TRIM39-like [Mustelus asterias]